ncbi:TolB-like translocation protein [Maribellus maritimus]|uniref:hypothetical protein n=1 Tax=Maribellus maritimus TaxID=2870838 RepID=UPI001EEAE946|nr:hypothetical protein [Maribellus maritimus]MCG6187777.1 hypothetical protein [Maribellus maritimus]
MKKLFFPVVLLFCFVVSKAQYFQTGEDPASIKWRQINTTNFQIIYPDYYETQAQKLTWVLEKVYNYGGHSLKHKPKKISVILHTQTVKSNGLVAWAPKRAEFYTTPHQDIYPQDWLEQLALHEFRHVVQVDKINSEIPGLIKAILGEQGTALIFGGYLPWWFIEGDAVATETALSKYGRGRFPSFLMEHKAQVVEKGIYSYDKAYNGSYKDFVPNHYKLGYYLVGNGRLRYGTEIWDSVLTNVGRQRFLAFSPFNSTLKKITGKNKVQFYQAVFDSLKTVWTEQDKKYSSASFQKISGENTRFTSYKYNHWLNDSLIISYKTSLDKIGRFVSIDKYGNEKDLFFPGTIFNESVDYRENILVWSEQVPDPRWSHSGKSLIRILNLDNKKKAEFYPEFKGFSPSISPDKSSVAVVETDFSNNYFVSVYSVPSGELLHRFQSENNNYFFSPEWLNENEMAVVVLTKNGKKLAKIDLLENDMEILVDSDLGEIKQLIFEGNTLYFISSYSGKNGLYSYNLNDKNIRYLYEPRFGAEYPAISENRKILLSNYTSDGFSLIKLNETRPVIITNVQRGRYLLAEKLAKQEPGIPDFDVPDTLRYGSKKYNKKAHLLNFHSWAPAFVDVNSYEITPGASIMSQNKLGTAETIFGYKWDVTEETGQFYARYTYKGWYPVLSFEISKGNRASQYYQIRQTKNEQGEIIHQDTTLQDFTWKITSAEANISVPFTLTRGPFNRLVQPEVQYEYTSYKHNPSTPDNFFKGNFQSVTYRLYYHQLLKQASMDVYPDFGIVLDGYYQHSPSGETDLGNQSVLQSILYLPGLMKNHGIRIYGGIQDKNISESFSFSDVIRYPRGWGRISTTEMYTVGTDYKFPVFYPEWSLAGILYLQRVKGSFFGDFARLKGNVYDDGEIVGRYSKDISSVGIEITGDVNFLRFYAPASIGLRGSYLPELNNMYFDLLFSVNFSSL